MDASGREVSHLRGVRSDYATRGGHFGMGSPLPPGDYTPENVIGRVYGPAGNGSHCPWCEGSLVEYDRSFMLARCSIDPSHVVQLMPWPG